MVHIPVRSRWIHIPVQGGSHPGPVQMGSHPGPVQGGFTSRVGSHPGPVQVADGATVWPRRSRQAVLSVAKISVFITAGLPGPGRADMSGTRPEPAPLDVVHQNAVQSKKKSGWRDSDGASLSFSIARDGPAVKKKWADIKSIVKKKAAERSRELKRTGGGKSSIQLDALEEKILGAIGETLVGGVEGGVDTGHDDDSINKQLQTGDTLVVLAVDQVAEQEPHTPTITIQENSAFDTSLTTRLIEDWLTPSVPPTTI
ncbi:hypothetical protein N1851_008269 [Merluccius polli]|uniref:Uncharacterized protein n=1 Tax=Merluccius polli TaxID=89951 RepID=A0AA47N2V0_MERPO|nr:hypothetical protein N1851_008269 [Merluccius polli]